MSNHLTITKSNTRKSLKCTTTQSVIGTNRYFFVFRSMALLRTQWRWRWYRTYHEWNCISADIECTMIIIRAAGVHLPQFDSLSIVAVAFIPRSVSLVYSSFRPSSTYLKWRNGDCLFEIRFVSTINGYAYSNFRWCLKLLGCYLRIS